MYPHCQDWITANFQVQRPICVPDFKLQSVSHKSQCLLAPTILLVGAKLEMKNNIQGPRDELDRHLETRFNKMEVLTAEKGLLVDWSTGRLLCSQRATPAAVPPKNAQERGYGWGIVIKSRYCNQRWPSEVKKRENIILVGLWWGHRHSILKDITYGMAWNALFRRWEFEGLHWTAPIRGPAAPHYCSYLDLRRPIILHRASAPIDGPLPRLEALGNKSLKCKEDSEISIRHKHRSSDSAASKKCDVAHFIIKNNSCGTAHGVHA